MTEIDFYVIKGDSADQRLNLVCRLTEKAIRTRQRLYIHTQDQAMCEILDACLWSFRDESFIPHKVVQSEQDLSSSEPVLIGHDREPDGTRQILINLAPETPLFFARFERLLEVINNEDSVREKGRERWSFYKSHAYLLKHHTIDLSAN